MSCNQIKDFAASAASLEDLLKDYPQSTTIQNAYAQALARCGKWEQSFTQLERTLQAAPSHLASLWTRANLHLTRRNFDAALHDFYQILRLDNHNVQARSKIRYIHDKLVGSWHFQMMNDGPRNQAYLEAIERNVKAGDIVFEIGTGSGLLAMMAARAGAKKVYTCEKTLPIAMAAREIIRRNGFEDTITVLHKWSSAVELEIDIPERADVLVSEILGPGLLGEATLQSVADVRSRLLKDSGRIIPLRGILYGALIEVPEIIKYARVDRVCGFDLRLFNSLQDEPSIQADLKKTTYRLLSDPFEISTLEFRSAVDEQRQWPFKVAVTAGGTCHGVVRWFRLFTDEESSVETAPWLETTNWEQTVDVFPNTLELSEGDSVDLVARQDEKRFWLRPGNLTSSGG